MTFSDLGLSDEVLRAVAEAGYTEPTPIQEQAIPYVLMGKDILGCAQTGTGKTAGFTLPMIDILAHGRAKARMPRSLILEPTRELAHQVAESFEKYGKYHKLSKALIIGGESMGEQMKVIDRGPDVLIATPGRLLDIFERGGLLLTDVKTLVIDEADRMLDMGFIPDVEKIVKLLSPIRQTLFFSATMPKEIRRLADQFLMNPKEITVSPTSSAAETVEQKLLTVQHGDGRKPGGGGKEKRAALRALIDTDQPTNGIIFCNRKRDVGVVYRSLDRHGYNAAQLHGDMPQSSRMEVLKSFRDGTVQYLVCSDVAARGLDIPGVSHVFNFDVPTHSEDYVHRIGRTGRAGRSGKAFTLATPEDGKYVAGIERMLKRDIPRLDPDTLTAAAPQKEPQKEQQKAEPAGEAKGGKKSRRRGGRGKAKAAEGKAAEGKAAEGKAAEAAPEAAPEPQPEAEAKPSRGRKADNGGKARKSEKKGDKRAEAEKTEAAAPKKGGERTKGGKVVGMGDHTPAFMLRPAMPQKGQKTQKSQKKSSADS